MFVTSLLRITPLLLSLYKEQGDSGRMATYPTDFSKSGTMAYMAILLPPRIYNILSQGRIIAKRSGRDKAEWCKDIHINTCEITWRFQSDTSMAGWGFK